MKTKLIALLKTSFASKGFSQKTLEGIADRLIENNNLTDQSTDEDFNSGIEAFKPFADLMQSEISRQVNEKKTTVVEAPTSPVVPVVPVVDPNEDATAKALRLIMEKLEKQETTIAQMGTEKVANTQKAQLEALIKDAQDDFKELKLEAFEGRAFTDEQFTAFLEKTKTQTDAHIQKVANTGLGGDRVIAGVGGSNSSTKKEATEAEVEAAFPNFRI